MFLIIISVVIIILIVSIIEIIHLITSNKKENKESVIQVNDLLLKLRKIENESIRFSSSKLNRFLSYNRIVSLNDKKFVDFCKDLEIDLIEKYIVNIVSIVPQIKVLYLKNNVVYNPKEKLIAIHGIQKGKLFNKDVEKVDITYANVTLSFILYVGTNNLIMTYSVA
jgi:hypothetical protein